MKQIFLFLFLFFFISKLGYGQFNYDAASADNINGVYTDLGNTGTAITTNYDGNAMAYDQDNSSIQNIGFNFKYDGLIFTQFVLNSYGFIKLGTSRPIVRDFDVINSTDNYIIAPFNASYLAGGQSPEYRVFTSGTTGSRICTIQFKSLKNDVFNEINFQIKLYEGSNKIEFIYGNFNAVSTPFAGNLINICIKGIKSSKSVIATNSYPGSWKEVQFIDGTQTNNNFDIGKDSLPLTGTTFQFNADQSQFTYNAGTAIYREDVYTDLNNSGNPVTTNYDNSIMTYDDDNSAIQDIGFNFSFNGSVFTQFVLNSNGFIKLGTSRPGSNNFNVLNSTDSNTIAAFNYNLDGGLSPEYRILTSGTAGSMVCTIQFKNLKERNSGQYSNINFQIKLYEGSNKIEFVYGDFIAGFDQPASNAVTVGIKANSISASVNATKTNIQPWSGTQFINGAYTSNRFNNQNNVLPIPGATFQFNVDTFQNEAKVVAVYTLSKIPLLFGTYKYIVQAKLANLGITLLNNLAVTLNVSGANTFSNTKFVSLDPGDTSVISFDPFSSWVKGNNTVTVSIPADDVNTDNIATGSQVVNDSVFSYTDTSPIAGARGFGKEGGILLTRYTIKGGSAKVTNVIVHISSDPNNIGNTVTAVVSAPDNFHNQSDPYSITASDLGTYKNFTINNPGDLPPNNYSMDPTADFYVGLEQSANATTAYYPVSYQDDGNPSRPGAYYEAIAPFFVPIENSGLGRLMIEAVVSIGTRGTFGYSIEQPEKIIAAWNFTGTNSPVSFGATLYDTALSSSNLITRGPGAPQSPGINSFQTKGFKNDGISTANTDYFQVELSPKAGDTLSIHSINFYPIGDSAFAISPGVSSQFAYSLNGTNFTLIGSPVFSISDPYFPGFSGVNFDLSTVPELQNIVTGNTVTLRYYASGQTASGSWGFDSPSGPYENFKISGRLWSNTLITNPVVPTGADFTLATCSSIGSGSIGFTSTGNFAPDNIYTAQLATLDPSTYVFREDTVTIGTLVSNANSGTVNFAIPIGTRDDSNYVIRIISSSPPTQVATFSQVFAIRHLVLCSSPQDYFRSVKSGDWDDISIWESSYDGITWIPSTFVPNELATLVTIDSTDTVTITTGVHIRHTIVYGKLKLLNGGANNGSISIFKYQIDYRTYGYSMRIEFGGILQVVSTAIFDSVIILHTDKGMEVYGMITIGDGSATNADGLYSFGTRDLIFLFRDASVFEWNSTSTFGPISNAVYFVDTTLTETDGVVGTGHPIFRLTKMPPGTFGGVNSTTINGFLQVNTPVTMSGSGEKIFRDGIKGSSTLTQAPGSGKFKTINPYAVIPSSDTSGTVVGLMDGTIHINLDTSGLTLAHGITLTDSADVKIAGPSVSTGKIELQPGGKMTIDTLSTLDIINADLSNDGALNGRGAVRFTGSTRSYLRSPGVINAKLKLSNKQLSLIGNVNASSVELTGKSNLQLDSFNLIMDTASLIGDSANFIITNDTGRLIRNVAATAVTFPVGFDSTSYTPVTVTNTGISGNFKVRVTTGVTNYNRAPLGLTDVTPIDSGKVNITWLIDASKVGSNSTINVQWNKTDELPGFDRAVCYISQLKKCQPPPNCNDSYYDVAARSAALGSNPYTQTRSNITDPTSFIVKSSPDVSTFTGNGNWNDPYNWTIGIVPSNVITNGTQIVINHTPGGQCIINGDIIIEPGGKLTVLPGKVLVVTGKIITQ